MGYVSFLHEWKFLLVWILAGTGKQKGAKHNLSHLQVGGPQPLAQQHPHSLPTCATSAQAGPIPAVKPGCAGSQGQPHPMMNAEHHSGEEKSVPTLSAAGLAWPGRWLVGGRHGPRSFHPPYGEGITQPFVSHVTTARHLTVHLVAL